MSKLWFKNKCLAQRHPHSTWHGQDLNPSVDDAHVHTQNNWLMGEHTGKKVS